MNTRSWKSRSSLRGLISWTGLTTATCCGKTSGCSTSVTSRIAGTRHCGMFPGIQQAMFWEKGPWESWKFEDLVLAPVHRVIHDAWARRWQEITLIFACNQGVRRSVSAAELTAAMLWGRAQRFCRGDSSPGVGQVRPSPMRMSCMQQVDAK